MALNQPLRGPLAYGAADEGLLIQADLGRHPHHRPRR